MDLAYESGALRGDISRIQYWALAYYLVSHRRDADERAELERKWHAFFADRKLYEQVFLKDQEDEEEQSAEFGDGDMEEAERMLAELDRRGEITIGEDNIGEWV